MAWIPPDTGWVKVNIDGSSRQRMRKAACGGVVRGEGATFLRVFKGPIDFCSGEEAELWGMYYGLIIA